ncbi:PTS transporter subunit EIIC [Amphibacillus sp. Q70]|uniref:PTS transporter subunit EIIC n=1 Tax=Amphibacillus sp. Q70 TaxID=3453416 RepID=UPI003F827931
MSYKELSKNIISNVGGESNISQVGHCATRLRINVYDEDRVDLEKIKSLEGQMGAILKNNQLQVIIGVNVGKAYEDFMDVSNTVSKQQSSDRVESSNKQRSFMDTIDTVGGFFAEVFMPILPALLAGGIILAINNFFVNNFGISAESGAVQIFLAIFAAAFNYLPIYIGFFGARKLKMSPIMGALLGGLLVHPQISGMAGLSFFGISIQEVDYTGSVLPVILGLLFMYYIDKFLDKIIPEFLKFTLKPILTMLVVAPVTVALLGPLGTQVSSYVGQFMIWLLDTSFVIALPILSVSYPYMVMFGIDKALMAIGFDMINSLGWEITVVMGFISNISIGAATIAVSRLNKHNAKRSGMHLTSGLTALFGVTEPAFYGSLIGRPKALFGVALGALAGGLLGGFFSLVSYIMGGTPGLLTLIFFLNPDGTYLNFIISILVLLLTVGVSYISTTMLLRNDPLALESPAEDTEKTDIENTSTNVV